MTGPFSVRGRGSVSHLYARERDSFSKEGREYDRPRLCKGKRECLSSIYTMEMDSFSKEGRECLSHL